MAALVEDEKPWEDRGILALMFKSDPIRAEVTSTSCCYAHEIFCDLLDEDIELFKFSTAVGSTTAVPDDPDCVIFECHEAVGGFSNSFQTTASAAHAEKPKGVSADLLQKIWQIDNDTAKITIQTTTQLNRQDVNSKLSRNFGTNDRMLCYR